MAGGIFFLARSRFFSLSIISFVLKSLFLTKFKLPKMLLRATVRARSGSLEPDRKKNVGTSDC